MKKNDKIKAYKLLISAIIAFSFLIIAFWASNLGFPISSEKTLLTWFDALAYSKESKYIDSVLIIDAHYDKQMLMEYDDYMYEDSLGRVAVVNRNDLLQLLNYLKQRKDYRYIMLDISFDKTLRQMNDTTGNALYKLIASMNNIVFARDSVELADTCMKKKAGYVNYFITVMEKDFVKIPYLVNEDVSLPLKMYQDLTGKGLKELTGKRLKNICPLYYDEGLSIGSSTLTFDLTYSDILKRHSFYDLHRIVENDFRDIEDQVSGKYILIGDFEEDIHSTYKNIKGEPGPIINFNAYLSLVNGHHKVSVLMLFFLFAIFWFLAYNTLHQSEYAWLYMWMGYPTYMIIFCFITYILFDEIYDVLISTTLFYFLKTIIDCFKFRKIILGRIKEVTEKIHIRKI